MLYLINIIKLINEMLLFFLLLITTQSTDVYQVYDDLSINFLNSFPHPSCIQYSSISLSNICQERPSILFISQFSVDPKMSCENDQIKYKSIQDLVASTLTPNLLKKFTSQSFMQMNFNYLKGDKFYDPPTVKTQVQDLQVKLGLICGELSNS